jgi:hypothetical protein
MMNYGGSLGIAYPSLMSTFLERVIDKNIYTSRPWAGADTVSLREGKFSALKVNAVTTLIAFPLGIYLGTKTKILDNNELGNLEIMNYLGMMSPFAYGYLLPYFAPEKTIIQRNPDPNWGDSRMTNAYYEMATGFTMALIPAGNYLAYRLVKDRDYSWGRGLFVASASILGAGTGAAIPPILGLYDDTATVSRGRIHILSGMAGHALGLWFGFDYHKETGYSLVQAIFIDGTAIAGGLTGLGIPFILDAKGSHAYKAFIAAPTIGAWGGFILGEYLARPMFKKMEDKVKPPKVAVSFPGLSAVPLIAASYIAQSEGRGNPIEIPYMPLVNVAF